MIQYHAVDSLDAELDVKNNTDNGNNEMHHVGQRLC